MVYKQNKKYCYTSLLSSTPNFKIWSQSYMAYQKKMIRISQHMGNLGLSTVASATYDAFCCGFARKKEDGGMARKSSRNTNWLKLSRLGVIGLSHDWIEFVNQNRKNLVTSFFWHDISRDFGAVRGKVENACLSSSQNLIKSNQMVSNDYSCLISSSVLQ